MELRVNLTQNAFYDLNTKQKVFISMTADSCSFHLIKLSMISDVVAASPVSSNPSYVHKNPCPDRLYTSIAKVLFLHQKKQENG